MFEKKSQMVGTTDYWYPNFSRDRVMATLQESRYNTENIIIIIRGEGNFAIKKEFPVSAINEAEKVYEWFVSSSPSISECYENGFSDLNK